MPQSNVGRYWKDGTPLPVSELADGDEVEVTTVLRVVDGNPVVVVRMVVEVEIDVWAELVLEDDDSESVVVVVVVPERGITETLSEKEFAT
jgi:hypothetical protein